MSERIPNPNVVKKTMIREVEVSTVHQPSLKRYETIIFNLTPNGVDNPEYHDATEEMALVTHQRVLAALELLGLPWPRSAAKLAWVVFE